jgi:hypothetical protein
MRGHLLTAGACVCAVVACGEAQAPPPVAPTTVAVGQTSAPAPAPPAAAPAAVPCVLRGDHDTGKLRLMRGGRTFAVIHEYVEWVEAQVTPGAQMAKAIVRGKLIDVVGDVALSEIHVAPRARPTGWALPTDVRVRSVDAKGNLLGELELPRVMTTPSLGMSFRCADLALGQPAWASGQSGGTVRLFRPGATAQMRDEPAGKVVGQLRVPSSGAFIARAFEERDGAIRLSVADRGAILEFWTSPDVLLVDNKDSRAAALGAQAESMQMQLLAALGGRAPGTSCAYPINIYVRDGSTAVVVGSLRRGAVMRRANATPQAQGEVPIDLGAHDPGDLVPFVLSPDVDGCAVPSRQPIATVEPGRGLVTAVGEPAPPHNPALAGTRDTPLGATTPQERRVEGPKGDVHLSVPTSSRPVPDLAQTLARARARVRHCYQTGLNSDPVMAGKLIVTARLAPNGEVASASVATNTGLSQTVASCVVSTTKRLQFMPPAGGAGATLQFAATFSRVP